MSITLPETAAIQRIGTTGSPADTSEARLALSALLGLDLVLGPIDGDADELDELARLSALVDMAGSGFIPSDATLDLIAGIVEDIETEDDLDGYEADDLFEGAWAA